MLNRIPEQINKAARAVVLRHPNAFDAEVFRKVLNRSSDSNVEGVPTLGGMAVLDSEDEPDVDWTDLGAAKLLTTDHFDVSQLVDLDNAANASVPQMFAMIESLDPNANPDAREFQKHDIVFLSIADNVKIGYEIMAVDTNINISPFCRRYAIFRRDDLFYVDGWPNK